MHDVGALVGERRPVGLVEAQDLALHKRVSAVSALPLPLVGVEGFAFEVDGGCGEAS
jgi:hypothetical protein